MKLYRPTHRSSLAQHTFPFPFLQLLTVRGLDGFCFTKRKRFYRWQETHTSMLALAVPGRSFFSHAQDYASEPGVCLSLSLSHFPFPFRLPIIKVFDFSITHSFLPPNTRVSPPKRRLFAFHSTLNDRFDVLWLYSVS